MKIERKRSTTWATWNVSNYAKPIHKYNALVVYLVGPKVLSYGGHARLNRKRFDALSISNYVLKKGCSHGAGRGNTEEQIYYHQVVNAWKRCQKKKDAKVGNYTGMLDRFLKSPRQRKSQEEHGWDEAKCTEMGKLAQEDHTYKLTRSEYLRCSSTWCLQLNSSGSIGPMATRPDYRAAVALNNHLHRNSEDYQKTIPPQDQDRVREGNKFSETYRQGGPVDKKPLWGFWTPSSSSASWWQSDQ